MLCSGSQALPQEGTKKSPAVEAGGVVGSL